MKAIVPCGFLHVEVEAETQFELLEEIGRAQEVFGDSQCGLCQSNNLRYRVREVEKNGEEFRYPELTCRACYARLAFGQEKKGGRLFPIRKLNQQGLPDRKTGSWGDHNGWHRLKKADDSGNESSDNDSSPAIPPRGEGARGEGPRGKNLQEGGRGTVDEPGPAPQRANSGTRQGRGQRTR
jgi:ribosomal protein L40E